MPANGPTFSWSHTPAESRVLRALVALPAGVLAGGVLAVGVGAVGLALVLLVGGNYALGVAVLLALAVSIGRVAPHHAARVSGGGYLGSEFRGGGRWWLVGGAAVGLPLFAVGAQFGSGGLLLTVVGVVVAPLVVASVLTSTGELDPNAGTLTYCGTDLELRTLAGFRRRAVGGYVAYRLSYVTGTATFGTPRRIVVPRAADDEVREALDAGVRADFDGARSSNRAVRVAAVAFGLCFLGFGSLLLTVEPASPNPRAGGILVYAALTSGGLGLLFLLVAARQ